MIICPNCQAEIDSDSKFCDQCGKELMYCPECKELKRGTECPRCGEDLVPARVFLSNTKTPKSNVLPTAHPDKRSIQSSSKPSVHPTLASSTTVEVPQGTFVAQPVLPSLSIIGNSWCLPVKAGGFGRKGGIYPEFATVQYISGNHGQFRANGSEWQIQDVGSTNGTFLNGQRLAPGQWYPIKKGDKIKIATICFVIQ